MISILVPVAFSTILDDNGFSDNVVQIADNDVVVIRTKKNGRLVKRSGN
ncbi:MAG: hypothetical protein CM1200mP6_06120 [Anaerolineaceae bacterium]|nr:MAG: hypothetical protein CM1200mP6_06120 [Anaerolineaceae bacterium]